MATGKYVVYYRVSTQKQGASGLGLDAQRAAVEAYLNGGDWKVVGEFREIESGKRSDRPQLALALSMCRIHGAKLLVAKLDRLARNVAFVSNLMESGVKFQALDLPEANDFTIHIFAAAAQHEAKAISDRTKAALAASKARGTKLGGFRGKAPTAASRQKALEGRRTAMAKWLADIAPVIADVRASGATSVRGIAAALNERGIPTVRGGAWNPTQVQRVIARIG